MDSMLLSALSAWNTLVTKDNAAHVKMLWSNFMMYISQDMMSHKNVAQRITNSASMSGLYLNQTGQLALINSHC